MAANGVWTVEMFGARGWENLAVMAGLPSKQTVSQGDCAGAAAA